MSTSNICSFLDLFSCTILCALPVYFCQFIYFLELLIVIYVFLSVEKDSMDFVRHLSTNDPGLNSFVPTAVEKVVYS